MMQVSENIFQVSLVIPIRNEESSIENLIESITVQTFQPDEIILVDAGSTDRTVEIVERLAAANAKIKLIKTDGATPGKGRNIGIEGARNEWIALTDAGIKLKADWLEELVKVAIEDPELDIVYGNISAVIGNLFEKCAALSYVPPQNATGIRWKSIASCLLRKKVWQTVGGFPDLRAAEDLMFMDEAERQGFKNGDAPMAMVYWNMRPDLSSTFSKFVLYSKHNVWAGRQWDWHYGILRQYLLLIPFLILTAVYSWWWLLAILLWLVARTTKRILTNRCEFGWGAIVNPLIVAGTAVLVLTIDLATFVGWARALISKK